MKKQDKSLEPISQLMGSIAGSQTSEVSVTTPVDCGKAESLTLNA